MPLLRAAGFSLVELVVSLGLMIAILASIFGLLTPTSGRFVAQAEAADMQQRLRVAADTLVADLLMAGSGPSSGPLAGPLINALAPVLPYRQGSRRGDAPGSYKTDSVTLILVPPRASQTTIRDAVPQTALVLTANADAGCPPPRPNVFCGFASGTTAILYDETGSYDVITIEEVAGPALTIRPRSPTLSKTYAAGSTIAEASSRIYALKDDDTTRTYQLMSYGGGDDADVPVADNVVGLEFEYYGDPQPPVIRDLTGGGTVARTTYGPSPPAPGITSTAYPAGENCVFAAGGAPRLPAIGPLGATALVKLEGARLSDGPWCPDESHPHRFDADLLRIRKIVVRVRVQAAPPALRGPRGVLFAKGGTSPGGHRYVPDHEVRFQVTPRNLNLGR